VHTRSAWTWRLWFDIDAIEQVIELALAQLDAGRVWTLRLGHAKSAFVQALVELAHPAAIEEQNLQGALALAEEDEERAAARTFAELFARNPSETIKAPSEIDGGERYEDFYACRDHGALVRARSASNTTRKVSALAPLETATRAPSISIRTAVVTGDAALVDRITRASRTPPDLGGASPRFRPSWHDHHSKLFGE
jgi:hypothetical protein